MEDPRQDPVVRRMRRAELAGEQSVTLQAAEVTALLNYFYREEPREEEPDPRSGSPTPTHCEDWPCCGHEWGDCFGQKYGTDESIKEAALERMEMEQQGYFCPDEE